MDTVDALNDIYLELFELIGKDAMLKLFKHFRGDKIDCPMCLYRPEFIADLAKPLGLKLQVWGRHFPTNSF